MWKTPDFLIASIKDVAKEFLASYLRVIVAILLFFLFPVANIAVQMCETKRIENNT